MSAIVEAQSTGESLHVQAPANDAGHQLPRIPWLTSVFLFVCFFLAIHDFQASTWDINRPPDFFAATSGSGSLQTKAAFLLLGMYGAAGYLRRRLPRLYGDGIGSLFAILLLAWTLLSFLWADNHMEPLGRLAGLVGLVLTALHLRRRYTSEANVRWITLCTFAYVVLGIVTEVALKTFTPWQFDYRFSGTLHPNAQGINCSIALLGACCMFAADRRRRWWWASIAVLSLGADILTKSRTALFSLLIAALLAALATRRQRAQRWLVLSSTVLIAAAVLWISSTGLLALGGVLQLGRDQSTSDNGSLTGRVPLWEELMTPIDRRPLVGQGYGAFWTANNIEKISSDQGWGISAAHSAYVDVLLALGASGLALYLAAVCAATLKARRAYRQQPDPSLAFFGVMLVFVIVDGVTDSEPVIVSAFLCFCFILAMMELLACARLGEHGANTPENNLLL